MSKYLLFTGLFWLGSFPKTPLIRRFTHTGQPHLWCLRLVPWRVVIDILFRLNVVHAGSGGRVIAVTSARLAVAESHRDNGPQGCCGDCRATQPAPVGRLESS